MVKITVLKVNIDCLKCKKKLIKAVSSVRGIDEIEVDEDNGTLTIKGNADPYDIIVRIRKVGKSAQILSIGPPPVPDPPKQDSPKKPKEDKKSKETKNPEEIKKPKEKSEEKPEEKPQEKTEETKKPEEKSEEKPEEKPEEKLEEKVEDKSKSEENNKSEPVSSDTVSPNQISNVPPYMLMPPQYYYPQYHPTPHQYYYPQYHPAQPTPPQYYSPQYHHVQAQPVAVLHMARWDEPDTSCTIL